MRRMGFVLGLLLLLICAGFSSALAADAPYYDATREVIVLPDGENTGDWYCCAKFKDSGKPKFYPVFNPSDRNYIEVGKFVPNAGKNDVIFALLRREDLQSGANAAEKIHIKARASKPEKIKYDVTAQKLPLRDGQEFRVEGGGWIPCADAENYDFAQGNFPTGAVIFVRTAAAGDTAASREIKVRIPAPKKVKGANLTVPQNAEPATADPALNLASITSYACYYGQGGADAVKKLSKYDLAIVNFADFGGAEKIAALKSAGKTKVAAYISIGEEVADNTSGKNWYITDKNGKPKKNGNWNSYYVNAGDADWQRKIIADAKTLLDGGADGLFLDTLDTVDIAPETGAGMVELVKKLRETYPNAVIAANRGFAIIEKIAPFIDADMFECFSSDYNFSAKKYYTLTGDELKESRECADMFVKLTKTHGFRVLTLDYMKDLSDAKLAEKYRAVSRAYNFVPYIADIDLERIFA